MKKTINIKKQTYLDYKSRIIELLEETTDKDALKATYLLLLKLNKK